MDRYMLWGPDLCGQRPIIWNALSRRRTEHRLTEKLQTIPQTSVEDFVARVLPPLPPVFGQRGTAVYKVYKVVEKLQSNGDLALLQDRGGTGYEWTSMPMQPKDQSQRKSEVFEPLQHIAAANTTAVDDCVWEARLQRPESRFQYRNAGDSKPERQHRRSTSQSRPDGYFFARTSELLDERKVHSWRDIGVVGEFNKNGSKENMHDDAEKVLWGLNAIMREDPRRRFAYGFTIENTTTRFWFCDRTQVISTEPFSFFEKPHFLVSLFLSALYADETAQGWDPTIVRVPHGVAPLPDRTDPTYQYEITVHSIDKEGRIENVVYRTEALLWQLSADGIYGRGTRIWTARRVTAVNDRESQKVEPLVVIKDCWVDLDRQREGDIVNHLRQLVLDRDGLPDKWRGFLLEHIPRIVHHGEVSISGSRDQTRSLQDIFKKDREGNLVTFNLFAGLRMSRETTDEGTRTHSSQPSFVVCPIRRRDIALLDPKAHYRVVFEDYGHSLNEETSLRAAFIAIKDVMRCLVALHVLGWVHRDISAGNILVVPDGPGQTRGLLIDFEHATEYDIEESRNVKRMGTEYFMSVEVDLHRYLFTSMDLRGTAILKLKPKEQQDAALGGLRIPEEDEIQILPVPPDKPPPPLPFRYHPLNDWESVWWVAMYMVVNRVVESHDTPKSIDEQREIACRLFYTTHQRMVYFGPYGPSPLDAKLESIVHPAVAKILGYLSNIKFILIQAYTEVESDITHYPDVQRSLELVSGDVLANIMMICKYLQEKPQSALRIKPFPPKRI